MEAPNASHIPPLNGLVLAGGESRRMGMDKGLIEYHGTPQREYVFNLINPLTVNTYISSRPGQIGGSTFPVLEDTVFNLGPLGAVLTAFELDPTSAWLVVACDFPLLDREALLQLLESRKPDALATSFYDVRAGLPEPWISILEPGIYSVLQAYTARGKSSLRGVLEDYKTHTILSKKADVLLNANTPEEVEYFKRILQPPSTE